MKDGSWDGKSWFTRFDFLIRLSLKSREVTDANQYFYRYDPERFSESLQSGHAEKDYSRKYPHTPMDDIGNPVINAR